MGQPVRQRRRYDSTLRRQRAAQTRERIVAAGSRLAHESPAWDWRALTVRAVAGRAGVSERTVYRHFPGERELQDAVMRRLEDEAGVRLDGLLLADVADATARVFAHLSAYPLVPRAPREATLTEADQRRRQALLSAVTLAAAGWPETDRRIAAAVLDMLWGATAYERLVAAWQLTPEQAAIAAGNGPGQRGAS